MCATDLDLDPEIAEIAEDEEVPGVAWGRAEPHPAAN